MIQYLETDCGNVFRSSKHSRKEIQFTKVFEDTSFFEKVSIGMCHKTIADVDDGFGDRTPARREYTHHPRADSDSRIYASITGRTIIGPVVQVHISIWKMFQEVSRTSNEDRTRRTHIFQSCWCSVLDSTLHTYMCACGSSQIRDMHDWDVLHTCAPS